MGEAKRRQQQPPPPEDGDLVDRLLRWGEAHARRVLIERGQSDLAPFYHLVPPDAGAQHVVVMAIWGSDIEKQLIVLNVKRLAQEIGAIAACFIGEGWMVKSPTQQPWTSWHEQRWLDSVGRPSESPDRVECVEVMATDGERYDGRLLQIVRDKPGGRVIALVGEGVPTAVRGRLIDDIIPKRDAA
jgi:hypothetical protein